MRLIRSQTSVRKPVNRLRDAMRKQTRAQERSAASVPDAGSSTHSDARHVRRAVITTSSASKACQRGSRQGVTSQLKQCARSNIQQTA